ncbi:unnamed protein product [Rotaria magnacalcarata]|uniref:Uncharacterized protein n=1 Tax=Rotaria magnacalcarata TaxID=392030 RepID=A0A820GLI2_9BILA|nr:unnamed protein product [Rotaria magnacalcarata]
MKAYLHLVKGTLREAECHFIEVDRRFWPMQVQSLILTQYKLTMNDTVTTRKTATPMEIDTEDQQIACENLLNEHLQKMKRQIEYYGKELDEKQSTFIRFTSTIQETIEIHVQTYGIKPLEMKRDLKLALVNYDYDSEMLQRAYFQEQPNNYQIEVAKCLSTAKVEVEKSKRTLLELKYRVFYNKPPDSFDSSGTLMPTLNHDDQRLFDKHEKAIQRRKLDLMTVKIAEAETKFYHSLKRFDHELATMWKNYRDLVKNQGMTTTLTNLIENRLKNITDRWRDIYNYRINNYIRNSYDNLDSINTKEIDQKSNNSGFSSFLIIDAIHQFSEKQLQLLNRGPTYVPPCQTSILSSCHSMDDIVERKYAPLKHQLNSLFSKHHINVALSLEIQQKISDQFADSFSVPIPSNLHQRALYEDRLILSIRYYLKKNNLILRRTADHMNTFYLGNRQAFETKAYDYVSKSDAYKVLLKKDKGNGDQKWQTELNQMVESMNLLLESLKNHESLNVDLYNGLLVDARNEISLVPYITSKHSATWRISKYLNELLRPFVDKILSTTTFRDEPDFMYQLYDHIFTKHELQSTTLFCAIKITNYYTLDTHKNMIDIVGCFLEDNLVPNKLAQVTIQTIKNLLHIFLYNNVFYYKDQIYTLTKGSPNTMPLSDTVTINIRP